MPSHWHYPRQAVLQEPLSLHLSAVDKSFISQKRTAPLSAFENRILPAKVPNITSMKNEDLNSGIYDQIYQESSYTKIEFFHINCTTDWQNLTLLNKETPSVSILVKAFLNPYNPIIQLLANSSTMLSVSKKISGRDLVSL